MIDHIKKVLYWISSHKKIVFLYVPALLILLLIIYILIIFITWRIDRDDTLRKLSKYKQLIDRTEELQKGATYSYRDFDVSAKAVDIPTRIYDRNNEIIGEFFEQKREIIPYKNIPEWVVVGVISSEDRDFYNHPGISIKGIFRAIGVNIFSLRIAQGGSTITQQLAKVLFTDMERSAKRKIYEAFCALEIENRYDKQDILSMYLNLIYFGNGSYGVESTSKMFFGKSVSECDEAESAMIVATISNPKYYSPISNMYNSVRKTEVILKSMKAAGYLSPERAEQSYKKFIRKWDVSLDKKNRKAVSLIGKFIQSSYRINRAPFFVETIRRQLVQKFGDDALKKGGLSVYTTIDAAKQDVAQASLRRAIERQRNYHLELSKKIRNEKAVKIEIEKSQNIEGALIAINPKTGEIISYTGGYDFTPFNQQDNVSQIKRQPGSSFKPFIYASAIEARDITPSTILIDEKTEFEKKYIPKNYDGKYIGEITARDALKKSINIPAVKVLKKTGYDRIFEFIEKSLNLTRSETSNRFKKTLSMALGSYEISPIENCILYSVIINGGDYIEPYGIKQVKDYSGNIIWNNEEDVNRRIEEKRKSIGRIIDAGSAAVTVSMLRGVFEKNGTAYGTVAGRKISFQIAGKTGTTSNNSDAWFAGFTSDLSVVVWIGNKQGSISLGPHAAGGSISAPVFAEYIFSVYNSKKPDDFSIPQDITSREKICLESGEVAGRNGECPETAEQVYLSGTEPGKYCHIHVKPDKEKKQENP